MSISVYGGGMAQIVSTAALGYSTLRTISVLTGGLLYDVLGNPSPPTTKHISTAECTYRAGHHHQLRPHHYQPRRATKAFKASVQISSCAVYSTLLQQQRRSMSTKAAAVPEGILLGLGNPLLDISVHADAEFLKKYNLNANDAIIADDSHLPMFEEMRNMNPQYIAGGATQNSIRVAQWLLGTPKAVSFFGCVGADDNARILEEKAKDVGVQVRYQVDPVEKTGVCGAVITGEDRMLVTYLGAALKFNVDFLMQNWDLVEKAQYYYIGGFVFSVSPESILKIAQHACENNKTLIMNLSAPFLCEYFVDPKIDIMQYVDILFGNEVEAAKFSELQGLKARTIQQMALEVTHLPKKNDAKRVAIFTQGRGPTIMGVDDHASEHPINQIQKADIKDTNGCGDSFVGGFLSQLVQGKPIAECIRCGNFAASTVIKHFGCTYPDQPDFE